MSVIVFFTLFVLWLISSALNKALEYDPAEDEQPDNLLHRMTRALNRLLMGGEGAA